MSSHPLDNPVWSALATTHAALAVGTGDARRYPPEIARLCAIRASDAHSYAALASLVGPDGIAPLFLDTPAPAPPEWTLTYARDIAQMVCDTQLAPPEPPHQIVPLGPEDVPEMLALIDLAKPGPFGPRTIELGDYLGIRIGNTLAAMAGTRLRPAGHTEISAVCTHPDFRRRGYGATLTRAVAATIQRRGETPFLHVKTDNQDAVRAYIGLGFRNRRTIHLRVLRLMS